MTNLTREETVWLQAYCAAITSVRDYPTVEASDAVKHFKEYFPTPTAEDKLGLNSVKGECELNRDFKIYDNGVRAGIQLGREAMLEEVLEYMRKTGDRFLECADGERQSIGRHWHIRADAIESKFKGNP